MLVLGYVRVSSIEQESGYGPQVQEEAIRSFCTDQGLPAPEIVHESMSGESIAKRKEFLQVLDRAKYEQESGGEAHIVFYRLDRLSRTLIDQETVVGTALRAGFRLHSTQASEADTLDPAYAGDPMRTAFRQLMGMFAQLERATIQARLDSGLHEKAKTGKSTGGRLPFGYMSWKQDIVVDPSEIDIVKRVFELHHHGLDLASIVAVAAREFPEKCSSWNKSTVSRMLHRRELYAQGRYRTRVAVHATDRPELIVIGAAVPGSYPRPLAPISTEAVWEKAPDPVPILTLSLLINASSTWITSQVKQRNMTVVWNKGKILIPLEVAKTLGGIAKAELGKVESKPKA